MLPNSGPSSTCTSRSCGLSYGEAWVKIVVNNATHIPLTNLFELINTAIGTQLRFFNPSIENQNIVMFAKVRQKEVRNIAKYALFSFC